MRSTKRCARWPTPAACTSRSTSRCSRASPKPRSSYGFENLERAFHGCPGGVQRTVHMCCGYPDKIDREDYPKADPNSYLQIADAIEYSCIDAVSFEDAHRP